MSCGKRLKSKKKKVHCFFIWLICFCILLIGCSDVEVLVFAQEQEYVSEEAMWQEEEGGTWHKGSFLEAVNNVYSGGGTVVLLSDISLAGGISVSKSGFITITSYDADSPCTIKNIQQDIDDRNNVGRIFTVTGGELRLQDIILDGGRDEGVTAYHPLICVAGQTAMLRMLDGTVLQNAENISQSMCGGGINVRNGQAYMYDGSKIIECKARHGGGIEINGSSAGFGMAGGSIGHCEADDGGGVYVNIGMFQMQGGRITGNRATKADTGLTRTGGGGIYVAGTADVATVLIRNGEITGNEAVSSGGGILVQGGRTRLQIEGGALKGNTAQSGGGVSVIRGTLKLYGGTVTDNIARSYGGGILGSPDSIIELQGSPKVFDNTAGDITDRFDNLYLDGAEDYSSAFATSPIRLTGALTDGVELGMSRWVRPDEDGHPYREMIVPGSGYTISQSDFDKLCDDRQDEHKELYADNMEKYAFIPYDGKIVMVLAVDITLDRDKLSLESAGRTAALTATVTPDNAPVKDVTWSSSDEKVATVDGNGVITAAGEGRAVITATTVSPYLAAASCSVTVGTFLFRLTTKAEHGKITYIPASPDGFFEEDEQITLCAVPDKGYQFKEDSFKAFRTADESMEVGIDESIIIMPDYDVTVEAVFEPVPYPIVYNLEGGIWKTGESNPNFYTIESGDITINNPVRSGYSFEGWTGTGLSEVSSIVKIMAGETGAREFTAVWKKEDSGEPADPTPSPMPALTPSPAPSPTLVLTPSPIPIPTTAPTSDKPENGGSDSRVNSEDNRKEEITEQVSLTEYNELLPENDDVEPMPQTEQKSGNTQNPKTGTYILWLCAVAVLCAFCMQILTLLQIRRKRKGKNLTAHRVRGGKSKAAQKRRKR